MRDLAGQQLLPLQLLLEGAIRAKARLTGNPVRGVVLEHAAAPYPPLTAEGPFNLLVFGGS